MTGKTRTEAQQNRADIRAKTAQKKIFFFTNFLQYGKFHCLFYWA
jgi:hypothetical protein